MNALIDQLRQEHAELMPPVERIVQTADAIDDLDRDELRDHVDETHGLLRQRLLPHAEREEEYLYPALVQVIGASDGVVAMIRDHAEVKNLTAELGGLRALLAESRMSPHEIRSLRRILYEIHALLVLHFAKEQEIYFPILDARLTADETRELLRTIEPANA